MDGWDVLLVNCFNSADIKLSIVSSHRTLSSSHYHLDNHLDHYHIGTSLLEGTIYEGDWVRGVRHGVGKLSFSDGMIVLWTIFIHLLICTHLLIYPSIHPSTHLSISLIHLSVHPLITHPSIGPSPYHSSIYQSILLSFTSRASGCLQTASPTP